MGSIVLLALAVCTIFLSGHVAYALLGGRALEDAGAFFRAGTYFFLGLGAVTLQMFFYSLASVPFFLPYIAAPWLVAAAYLSLRARKMEAPSRFARAAEEEPANTALKWICVAIIASQAAYAFVYSPLLPVTGWDSIQTWFFKGHIFYEDGGVRKEFLLIKDIHPDYPLLVPLSAAFIYSSIGEFSDQMARALYPFQFISLVFIFYHVVKRASSSQSALVFSAMLSTLPVLMVHTAGVPEKLGGLYSGDFAGYADLPLAAYFAGAAGFLYLWVKEENPAYLALFALFAGFSAWTKDEGIPFVAAGVLMAAAHALIEKKGARAVATVVALAALAVLPWALYKAVNAVPPEYETGVGASTIIENLKRLPHIAGWLGFIFFKKVSLYSFTWHLYVLGLVLNWKGFLRRPLIYLNLLLFIQLTAYVGVYVITHLDLEFHLGTSLDRLALQLAPLSLLITAVNFHEAASRVLRRP